MNTPPDIEDEVELPVCLSCLQPNTVEDHFCRKCGAPLDSYAATAPFESIFAQGHVFRGATEGKPRLIVVIGVWLIFLPALMISLLDIVLPLFHSESVVNGVFSVPIAGFCALMIILCTRRYFRSRPNRSVPPTPPAPSRVPPTDPW